MDIREGDVLVVGGKEYPVKTPADWDGMGLTLSFRRLAKLDARIKRKPAMVDGMRGDAELLPDLYKCTPVDPIDPQMRQRLAIESPYDLRQTFISDSTGFIVLIVEDVK